MIKKQWDCTILYSILTEVYGSEKEKNVFLQIKFSVKDESKIQRGNYLRFKGTDFCLRQRKGY